MPQYLPMTPSGVPKDPDGFLAGSIAMELSNEDFETLRTHSGHTAESQAVCAKLREAGQKFCGVCNIVKTLTEFHRNSSTKDGRHGVCKSCDKRNKSRAREGVTLFNFTDAERNARYRMRMTPEERVEYDRRGNAQRRTA